MIDEFIGNLILDQKYRNKIFYIYGAFLALLIPLAIVITILSIDENKVPNSLLNEKLITSQINIEELKFRDDVVNSIDTITRRYRNINNDNDSIVKRGIDTELLQQFLILRSVELTNNLKNIEVDIPDSLQSQENPLLKIKKISISYSINKEKLKNIIVAQNNLSKIKELIKFGDYIDKSITAERQFQWYIVVYFFIITIALILIYLIYKNIKNKKNEKRLLADEIAEKEIIEEKQQKLANISDRYKTNSNAHINIEIVEIKDALKKLEVNSSIYIQLRNEVEKSDNRARDIFQRSTLMLILGLTIALIGASGFYFFLPEFKNVNNLQSYFLKSIRPTLILIFIQSIAIYLLRQYRILLEDYKYFQRDYDKRATALSLFQIIKNDDLGAEKFKLMDYLMSKKDLEQSQSKENNKESMAENKDNFEVNSKLLSILEKGIDKIIK